PPGRRRPRPIPREAGDGPAALPVAPGRPAIPRPPQGPPAQRLPPERRRRLVGQDPRRPPLHHPPRRSGRIPHAVLTTAGTVRDESEKSVGMRNGPVANSLAPGSEHRRLS